MWRINNWLRVLLQACLVTIFFTSTIFAYPFPHDEKWSYYETEHFNIYFTDKTKQKADEAFDMVENIYSKITKELKYSPQDKIELVLEQSADNVNGYADYFFQTIVLETAPAPTSMLGPFRQNDLYNLISHELTHIIHISKNNANPLVYRLLKRLTSKGFLYPQFIIEGYAIYNEKHIAQGGRLFNSSFEEQIMAFAKYDNFPKLTQITNRSMLRWPQGSGPYIVGAKFLDYIVKRYGNQKLLDSYETFVADSYISGYPEAFKKIYEMPLEKAYKEFIDFEQFSYINKSHEETTANLLITGKGQISNLSWVSADAFMYCVNEGKTDPAMVIYNLRSKESKCILQKPYLEGTYKIYQRKIYYLKYGLEDIYRTDISLYVQDLQTKEETLVASHVTNFDVGDKYLFIIKQGQRIYQMNIEDKVELLIKKSAYLDYVKYNSVTKTLFYIERNGTHNVLCSYNLVNNKVKTISEGNIRDLSFDEEGNLFVAADWDGFSQAYRYLEKTNAWQRFTNVYTGVYGPVVKDGKLIYATLTDKGINVEMIENYTQNIISQNYKIMPEIYVVPTEDKWGVPSPEIVVSASKVVYPWDKKVYKKNAQDYNIFNLNLLYFLPFFTISNYGNYVGITGLLSDPMQFQQFNLNYVDYYGTESYSFQYILSAMYPFLAFSASKKGAAESLRTELMFPMAKDKLQQNFALGFERAKDEVGCDQYMYIKHSLSMLSIYNNSISRENGFTNDMLYKRKDNDAHSFFLNETSLYMPGLAENHVVKMYLAYGESQVGNFVMGGYPNYYYVRGYSYFDTKKGPVVGRANLEYAYPLWVIDNIWMFSYYVYNIVGTYFVDIADASSRDVFFFNPYYSYGFMLNVEGIYSNYVPLNLGIGISFMGKSETKVVFSFGMNLL